MENMYKFKTLNNGISRCIIENAVCGNPKFTFIRLYNSYKDNEFEPELFNRLYSLVKRIIIETHDLEDILFAIDDCPLSVKAWLRDYKKSLKGGVKNESMENFCQNC